jgi:hypothetical protein
VKDFRSIAKACGLDVPDRELDRIVAPLESLELAFRPLVQGLKAEHEPATAFCAAEDGE